MAHLLPHIIDQFVWNRLVATKGYGPLGVTISKLSVPRIEEKLLDLWENNAYKKHAQEVSAKMKSEDFSEELVRELIGP